MIPCVGFGRAANFVIGAQGSVLSKEEVLTSCYHPIAWSGVGHYQILEHVKNNNLDYFYIDTGYFGNQKTKLYKRITKNDLNDNRNIIDRPADRIDKLHLDYTWYPRGDDILIVPPDAKVLRCFANHISVDSWIQDTIAIIRSYSQRKIIVRTRNKSRAARIKNDRFIDVLQNNINSVVVWSSNCAVESIIHGIPVISLGPTATRKISPWTIDKIEELPNLEKNLVDAWLRHLSYCQFTEEEMKSGVPWKYIIQ